MPPVARTTRPDCRAWELLMRFVLAERSHLPAISAELQLSPVQCRVLYLIEPDRPIPMGRLAETLACDASNVTGLVDRLEMRKLVERRPSPHDRRVKVLALTPAGVRLRALLRRRMSSPPDPLSRLTPDDQRKLVEILERVLE